MDFTHGMAVVSSARKLIFKVPASPEKADFPAGAVISEYGQNNENPVIVVFNATDSGGMWQGADGENGVVIMNEVLGDVAHELLNMVMPEEAPALGAPARPSRAGDAIATWKRKNPFTVEKLQAVIARAEALGCTDNYTTDTSFVDSRLSPAGRMIDTYTGIVKRDDRDVCLIVLDQHGVIQRKLPGDGKVNHIEEDILLRTYVMANGAAIDPTAIPALGS